MKKELYSIVKHFHKNTFIIKEDNEKSFHHPHEINSFYFSTVSSTGVAGTEESVV